MKNYFLRSLNKAMGMTAKNVIARENGGRRLAHARWNVYPDCNE
jgi:hypothetical protein